MKSKVIIAIISFFIGFSLYPAIFGNLQDSVKNTAVQTKSSNKASIHIKEKTLSGEGVRTLGPFTFKENLVVLDIKNTMGPNRVFTVSLSTDDNGNGIADKDEGWTGLGLQVAYEEAENFKGSIAFKPENKPYFIYVSGGKWEIKIKELPKLSKHAPDFTKVAGKGYSVTKKFYLPEGNITFKAKNTWGGNFIIHLVDENGNFTGRLVNEIGDTEKEFTYNVIFPGNYLFYVRGGSWSIEKSN